MLSNSTLLPCWRSPIISCLGQLLRVDSLAPLTSLQNSPLSLYICCGHPLCAVVRMITLMNVSLSKDNVPLHQVSHKL